MNLTKKDIYLVSACYGHNSANQDHALDSAVAMIIGHLVTATNEERLKTLEAMRTAAIDVMEQLPELIQKLSEEIAAAQRPAPEEPAYYQSFSND